MRAKDNKQKKLIQRHLARAQSEPQMCDLPVLNALDYSTQCLNLDLQISNKYHPAHRSSVENGRFGPFVNNHKWVLHLELQQIAENIKKLPIRFHVTLPDQIPRQSIYSEADIVVLTLLTITNPLLRFLRSMYPDLEFQSTAEETITICKAIRTTSGCIDTVILAKQTNGLGANTYRPILLVEAKVPK